MAAAATLDLARADLRVEAGRSCAVVEAGGVQGARATPAGGHGGDRRRKGAGLAAAGGDGRRRGGVWAAVVKAAATEPATSGITGSASAIAGSGARYGRGGGWRRGCSGGGRWRGCWRGRRGCRRGSGGGGAWRIVEARPAVWRPVQPVEMRPAAWRGGRRWRKPCRAFGRFDDDDAVGAVSLLEGVIMALSHLPHKSPGENLAPVRTSGGGVTHHVLLGGVASGKFLYIDDY
uniref:Uncharacterized protein n=1 Tax=Oryza sativa subsp. japonica TaxID=39947 RepID=Q33BD6_ORYSJ|nr:hypothetical protein LOC_Os10g02780 [Oryza sativa Japonica Group]